MRESRNKHDVLWLLIAAVLVTCYLGYNLAPPIVCYFYGKETQATVTRYRPTQDVEGHRIHNLEITYDGHTAMRRSSKRYDVGHQRQVIYLPERPNWVALGSHRDSLWTVIDKNTNDVGLMVTTGFVVLLWIAAIGHWRKKLNRE